MGKFTSVIVGVALIAGALIYQRVLGVRTEFEYFILRTVVALGGGYATAGLLGTFELQNKLLKAGSGFGVMVFLFLVNPVGSIAVATAAPEKKAAIETVDSLLRLPNVPEKTVGTAVDSLSVVLGFQNYDQIRVLASPQVVQNLKSRSLAYVGVLGK